MALKRSISFQVHRRPAVVDTRLPRRIRVIYRIAAGVGVAYEALEPRDICELVIVCRQSPLEVWDDIESGAIQTWPAIELVRVEMVEP